MNLIKLKLGFGRLDQMLSGLNSQGLTWISRENYKNKLNSHILNL